MLPDFALVVVPDRSRCVAVVMVVQARFAGRARQRGRRPLAGTQDCVVHVSGALSPSPAPFAEVAVRYGRAVAMT